MSFETLVDVLRWAWRFTPFPWLLAALALASFVWLWIEYQSTRLGRMTPGWRRPVPVLPGISVAAVITIRLSWILVRLWVLLFLVVGLTQVAWLNDAAPADLHEGVLTVGDVWRQGYSWLVALLPAALSGLILPSG